MFGLPEPGEWFASVFTPGTDWKPGAEVILQQDSDLETILEMWDVLPD